MTSEDTFQGSTEQPSLSVIIPALNEAGAIRQTIEDIHASLAKIPHEIIVVNDGSTDSTGDIAKQCGAKVISHPAPGGYGNALKSGICASQYELLAIIDSDGTYPPDMLPTLYAAVAQEGFHMAVGARQGKHYHGGALKRPARKIFTALSEFSSGRHIPDVNSGLRVFRKADVMLFYDTLCTGFSFTTTITLAYMLKGYFIKYIPISYYKREGSSKVRHLKDSLGSLQIIVQSILYYNPLKIFLVLLMFLTIGGLGSLLAYFFDATLGLMVLLFTSVFLLILGLGFLSVVVAFLAGLTKDKDREKHEFSHFVNALNNNLHCK